MKKEQNKTISLKKLTIARINPSAMHKIHGGDCIPTEVENSINHCPPEPLETERV